MNLSCAQLVKSSATQIVYLAVKRRAVKVTKQMKKGDKFAKKIATSNYIEMRGTYLHNDLKLHFTFDEIITNDNNVTLVEVKSLQGKTASWYLTSSALQLAFYTALSTKVNEYYTAKFARKEYTTKYINIKDKNVNSLLIFGKDKYKIEVLDADALIKYFTKKADIIGKGIINLSLGKARKYDAKHKFKHYDKCKSFFTFSKL